MSEGLGTRTLNRWLWLERVAEDRSIGDSVKLYALALVRGANGRGCLWANQEYLESWIGHMSTGKSSTKAKVLAEGGWLQITNHKLNTGFFSSAYQLRFPTNVGANTVKKTITKETTEPQSKSAPPSPEDFIGYTADGSPWDRRQPPSWTVNNDH